MLNLNSVMVGLQYLFLEPNADDPLNKGMCNFLRHSMGFSLCLAEAAEELRRNRDQFLSNVAASMGGRNIKGVQYDNVRV